jgi:adenosylcobinamide-GDP ribazoletransferase
MMKAPFLLALSLLTRFPVPALADVSDQDSGWSALFYPVIGLLIGLLLVVPLLVLQHASPLTPAILVLIWVLVTGGLHLDGLADSADAWLGGFSQGVADEEKTHAILKDSALGMAGVVAIVCVLLLKYAAIASLLQVSHLSGGNVLSIMMAPVIGRTIILLLFQSTDYKRENGLASVIVANLPANAAGVIILLCFAIALLVSAGGLLFVLIGFWLLRRLMILRLGGFTGDTVGASVEITELLWLVGAVLL